MPPHEVLGVPEDAGAVVIKAAFRRFVHRHHPDHGGDPAVFRSGVMALDAMLSALEEAEPAVLEQVLPATLTFYRHATGVTFTLRPAV